MTSEIDECKISDDTKSFDGNRGVNRELMPNFYYGFNKNNVWNNFYTFC